MKAYFLSLFFLMILCGCGKNEHKSKGPLTGITKVQLAIVFLSSEKFDQSAIIESFKKWGNVEILEEKKRDSLPLLLVSIDNDEEKKASLQVFAEVEVIPSHFKMATAIWKVDSDRFLNLPFPVEREDGVAFERPVGENRDFKTVFSEMVEEFAKEYQRQNPDQGKPTFVILKGSTCG